MPGPGVGTIGDLIALAQLALQVKRMLWEISAAHSEIHELARDVEALEEALQWTTEVFQSMVSVPAPVQNAVAHAAQTCQSILHQIQRSLDFSLKARGRNPWNVFRVACTWTLLGGKAVAERHRQNLATQISSIQFCLCVLQSRDVQQLVVQISDHRVGLVALANSRTTLPRSIRPSGTSDFRFFDENRQAVPPLAILSYYDFLSFFKFIKYLEGTDHNPTSETLYTQVIFGDDIKCHCFLSFQFYIQADTAYFGQKTAIISPLQYRITPGAPTGVSTGCMLGLNICGDGWSNQDKASDIDLDDLPYFKNQVSLSPADRKKFTLSTLRSNLKGGLWSDLCDCERLGTPLEKTAVWETCVISLIDSLRIR